MRNQKTREDYQRKFNELMKSYIYVPQEGEIIKQASEPYPAYWFVSNKCYVFSIHSGEIKILKLLHRLTGKKGKKRGQDWYYFYNKGNLHKIRNIKKFILSEIKRVQKQYWTLKLVSKNILSLKPTFHN